MSSVVIMDKRHLTELSDRNALLLADKRDLITALTGVLELIDSNYLVRDVSRDDEPGWAMRQFEPIRKLANARALLERLK